VLDFKEFGKYIFVMNFYSKITLFAVFMFSTLLAGALLQYFTGKTEGDNVRLEWQTTTETNLQKFVIQRKTPQSSYADIVNIAPKGNNSYYTYLDESVYKSNGDNIYIYRLKILDNDGQASYSNEVSVSPNISGIKRTWGSIKAMFR
jgi:hypothetical protein